MKIRGNTEFRFSLHDVLIVAGGIKYKKPKKATVGTLAKLWDCIWTQTHQSPCTFEIVTTSFPPKSWHDEWQDYQNTNSEESVSDD